MEKKLLFLKQLKYYMIVKQNETKGNRADKGEVKWTKRWCIGVTFVQSWF